MTTRTCSNPNCQQENPQPQTEFIKDKNRKSGLHPWCKSCLRRYRQANKERRRPYLREWYKTHRQEIRANLEANQEKRKEYLRQYYQSKKGEREADREANRANREANREKKRQYQQHKKMERKKAYYAANKERLLENTRRRNQANPDKVREQTRRFRRANPGIAAAYQRERQARKTINGGSHTIDEWLALCEHYDNRCLACEKQKPLTVDHVVPISKGGSNDIANIQPLCRSCNSAKGTKIIDYRPKWDTLCLY